MQEPKPQVIAQVNVEAQLYFGSELQCPVCGEKYLHQRDVIVFDRGEDDVIVRRVSVGKAVVVEPVPNEKSGNPSLRRNGLAVEFECEQCTEKLTLQVAQHKGYTLLSWVVRRDLVAEARRREEQRREQEVAGGMFDALDAGDPYL